MTITLKENLKQHLQEVEHRRMPSLLRRSLVRFSCENPYNRMSRSDNHSSIIFIHVPKTGGTSLAEALGVSCGHVPISRYKAWDPAEFERRLKVAVVRNPLSRLASAYHYLYNSIGGHHSPGVFSPDAHWAEEYLSPYPDFQSFVLALANKKIARDILSYKHFRPQLDWIKRPEKEAHEIELLVHYEAFLEGASRVLNEVGAVASLGQRRVTKKKNSDGNDYNLEIIKVVGDLYCEDIRQLGYQDMFPVKD